MSQGQKAPEHFFAGAKFTEARRLFKGPEDQAVGVPAPEQRVQALPLALQRQEPRQPPGTPWKPTPETGERAAKGEYTGADAGGI